MIVRPDHQAAAQNDRNQGEPRHKRDAEGALAIGLPATKQDHSQRNQNESEKRPDVGEVGGVSNVHEAGGNSYGETRDPGGPMRRLIFRVHRGE